MELLTALTEASFRTQLFAWLLLLLLMAAGIYVLLAYQNYFRAAFLILPGLILGYLCYSPRGPKEQI